MSNLADFTEYDASSANAPTSLDAGEIASIMEDWEEDRRQEHAQRHRTRGARKLRQPPEWDDRPF